MSDRFIYIKGGDVASELRRLLPCEGETPYGGPDQYLLGILSLTQSSPLLVLSLGSTSNRYKRESREAIQLAARPEKAVKLRKALAYLIALIYFTALLIRRRPTYIFCGIEGPFAVVALKIARLINARFVYFSHCALDTPSMSALYRKCNRSIVLGADHIIANGPYLTAEAGRLANRTDHISEFNVGMDPDDIEAIEQHHSLSEQIKEDRRIVFAGRVEVDKGALDLLEAVAKLPSNINLRLDYYGAGGAESQLAKRISELGLSETVNLRGEIPYRSLLGRLQTADVVVTPTQKTFPEGRCKTAVESLVCGTPVIAPNFGPFPFLVQNGINGLLYEADSLTDLNAKLQDFFSSSERIRELSEGAWESGKLLRYPIVTFYQAVARLLVSDG